jgi:hypothetical protein
MGSFVVTRGRQEVKQLQKYRTGPHLASLEEKQVTSAASFCSVYPFDDFFQPVTPSQI